MSFKMKYIAFIIIILSVLSCKKVEQNQTDDTSQQGLLVLNEGLFQLNNSSLSWIDEEERSINQEFFEQKTGRKLGDTGNDILKYGTKIYILVNVSSTIEILDAKTYESIKQLSITENGNSVEPRFMTAINGEIYFSTFAGKVWCLDTTHFEIINKIQVGLNPDQITNDGQYIYVSNSGGLNPPLYDSTVSVINPLTKTERKRITVGKNPGNIIATKNDKVYVVTRGNYTTLPPKLHQINTQTLEKEMTYDIQATHLVDFSSSEMIIGLQTNNGVIKVAKFNFNSEQVTNQDFISTDDFGILHNMQYSPESKRFFLMDADNYTNSGKIKIYNQNGDFIRSYQVGLNPTKLLELK